MLRFISQPSGPVIVRDFTAETIDVLTLADRWSHLSGIVVDVNAIDNGTHGPSTLHGSSRAWDLDTAGDRPENLADLYHWMRARLAPGYDVVREASHVHVEWQPKR